MPRRARLKAAGVPFHITKRGYNHTSCFFTDDDYQFYLDTLEETSKNESVAVHAYSLLPDHVNILLTPKDSEGASRMMKKLSQRYVQHINRTYSRKGTLWDGRFRSCLIDAENYLLICQRYIELDPVRSGIVDNAEDHLWSSYLHNALGETNTIITPHHYYLALANNHNERLHEYRSLFQNELDPEYILELKKHANGGYCIGNKKFKEEIKNALGCKVSRGTPGRPASNK